MLMLKKIKNNSISIIILLLFCSCDYYDDTEVILSGDTIFEKDIYLDSLVDYQNFKELYKKNTHYWGKNKNDSIVKGFQIQNENYLFLSNTNLELYRTKKNLKFNEEFSDSFIMIDNTNKIFKLIDSIYYIVHKDIFFETRDFYYSTGIIQGSAHIFKKTIAEYKSSVILIKKYYPSVFKIKNFYREKIIAIAQINSNIRIITTILEESYPLHFFVLNKLNDHVHLGEFVSKGIYQEYLYNHDLDLISRKEIDEDDI